MYWLYNLCLFGSCATLQHPYSVVETGRVFELIAEAKGELAPNHRASVILQQVGQILSSLGKPEKRPPPPSSLLPLGAQGCCCCPDADPEYPLSGPMVYFHAYCDRIDDAFFSRTLFS